MEPVLRALGCYLLLLIVVRLSGKRGLAQVTIFDLILLLLISQTVGQALIGNDKDHLTTHVSYKLDLRGPSVTVQTACSTSLVAVSVACRSLLGNTLQRQRGACRHAEGQCRMATRGLRDVDDVSAQQWRHVY